MRQNGNHWRIAPSGHVHLFDSALESLYYSFARLPGAAAFSQLKGNGSRFFTAIQDM